MNKATRRPRRSYGLQLTKAQRSQLRKDAQARLKEQRSTSYLKGVEGCTYRPLVIVPNAAHSVVTASGTTSWRDRYNASK